MGPTNVTSNSFPKVIKFIAIIVFIFITIVINILVNMDRSVSLVVNWIIYSLTIIFIILIFSSNDVSIYQYSTSPALK